jgi:hypothetical protein
METLIPPAVADIFADPPLVRGEAADAYLRMVAQLGAESGAAGAADWFLVKDLADLTWQIARTRRWVSAFTVSGERYGLATAIEQVTGDGSRLPGPQERALADAHYDDPDGAPCTALVAQRGVPLEHVGAAHAFFEHLESFTAAEELLTQLERRRDRVLAQIEARRAAFGAALRAASHRVVEAEVVTDGGETGPDEFDAVAHDAEAAATLAPAAPPTVECMACGAQRYA